MLWNRYAGARLLYLPIPPPQFRRTQSKEEAAAELAGGLDTASISISISICVLAWQLTAMCSGAMKWKMVRRRCRWVQRLQLQTRTAKGTLRKISEDFFKNIFAQTDSIQLMPTNTLFSSVHTSVWARGDKDGPLTSPSSHLCTYMRVFVWIWTWDGWDWYVILVWSIVISCRAATFSGKWISPQEAPEKC